MMKYTGIALLVWATQSWAAPTTQHNIPDWTYTVRPGDTLTSIAQTYLKQPQNWQPLQRKNHIANPHQIPPGTQLRIPADVLKHAPSTAKLIAITGSVQYRLINAAWQPASVGQQLPVGTEIQTAAEGYALLELANGTRIGLQAASDMTLDTLSLYANGLMADTRLRLQNGQTSIVDNPQHRPNQYLRIITPTAQAVVRGTEFRVAVDGNTTREETLAGGIALSAANKTVAVDKGKGSLSADGQPPRPPVTLLAAPDVSTLPKQIEQLPIRFPMPALVNAQAWHGEVVATAHPETVLLDKTTAAKTLNFADLPNGDYVLRLRGVDALGLQGYDAAHAFKVFARPFFPPVSQPREGSVVRSPRAAFSWGQLVDVTATHIQIAATADFKQPLFDTLVSTNSWTPSADLPVGQLYWRAASVDKAQGPWGATVRFIYKPAPGAVDLSKAALRFDSDYLYYDLPKPEADMHYQLSLAQDAEMKDRALAPVNSSTGMIKISRPRFGGYYLGVRQIDDGDGTAGPMAIQKIDVPIPYPYIWLGVPLLLLF
ncbi:MAG: FecR domain-containing protein [Sulfuriferula sp.]